MKKPVSLLLALSLCAAVLSGCGQIQSQQTDATNWPNAVSIELAHDGIKVNGEAVGTDPAAAVYAANDIVYYEEGHDFTYGEGTEADAHSAEEATAHTVVHITRPGSYVLSGTLSAGQVAVDLGEDAKEDPEAVVTLILNGVNITNTVAPAIIFYNVYECGSTDAETATKDVDTSAAGANVIIADGTDNYVTGSYVARIYKPESVVLNENGTKVVDEKKLHKYDAAFYSKMSMNVSGGEAGTGLLYINAENEGLDSELHLTLNGGNIMIESGNDGINTNEDNMSVTTVNGGYLAIIVTGTTGEGDGIDSNGWLVINGGTVIATACGSSMDSGIDSDRGIHINGGTVIASGHMLDRIEAGGQNYAVFQFDETQSGEEILSLCAADGAEVMSYAPVNACSNLIFSSPDLTAGDYTLWQGDVQMAHSGAENGMGGMMGGFRPGGFGGEMPEDFDPAQFGGGIPGGFDPGSFDPGQFQGRMLEGMERPGNGSGMPEGGRRPGGMGGFGGQGGETSTVFALPDGGCVFSGVKPAAEGDQTMAIIIGKAEK